MLLLVVLLNVARWCGLGRLNQDAKAARWRNLIAVIGLVANTLAIVLPFVAFLYGVHIDHLIRRGPVNRSDVLDLGFVIPGGLGLAAFGLLAGTAVGNPTVLYEIPDGAGWIANIVPSPDGKRLAFTKRVYVNDVMLLENF